MNTEDKVVPFTLHDKLCEKAGMTAKWADGDTISLYAYQHKTIDTPDKPTEFADQYQVSIFHLKSKFIFDEPILRGLLAEANRTFCELQERSKPESVRPDYLKISQTYRSIIRECLQKLQKDAEKFKNYITIFYSIECLWHLCEIFLIDTIPSNFVVPHLVEWIRFHFPAPEQQATELLFRDRDDMDISEGDYLKVVKSLILQGHLDVARTILQLYTRNNYNTRYQIAEEILKSVPIYNISGGLSLQSWRSQRQYWVNDTENKIQMGCFDEDLEEIISLVTGNETTWMNVAAESDCWYEYLPGYLFYTKPNCTNFQLGTEAERWLNRWSNARRGMGYDNDGLKHLDNVILKIMQNDLHEILRDVQNMCDHQWFATHLTDLLWHCGKLNIQGDDQTNNNGSSLRESLLFDFGSLLMAKESFWIFGLDYLEQCGVEGNGAIELLLPKINIRNEKQAMKIVNIARSKGLHEVEKEICRIQSVRSFKNERYGNALEWALRSQDNVYVTAYADHFLRHYAETGEILCPDVVLNVGPKMFVSPRLVFLTKYFDFQNYYRQKQFPQAAELLVNLLDSKIAPGYFWPSMFADTLPMLEAVDPIFSSKETYKIMHYLENQLVPLLEKKKELLAKGKENAVKWLSDSRIENISDMLKLIRMACIRNLSRALIIENTDV